MPKRPRVLAIILAGGEGSRLELLTEHRAKPSLSFAGTFRLIDVPLSNLMHSGLADVWLVEQYRPHSLNDHLANGRPWDLDRTYGGLRVFPPFQGTPEEGFAEGNADALWRQRRLIEEFAPDLVLVLSADHIYQLDFRDVIERHVAERASLTMVVTEVSREAAKRSGVVEVDGNKITGFDYKPDNPKTNIVAAEVFLYDARILLETLRELAEDDSTTLKDYGHDLIPRLVAAGNVHAFALNGYWRDVGTLESYWDAHMDVLRGESIAFDDPAWPILTAGHQRLPARLESGAVVHSSLIASGCTVAGRVTNSVLGAGVVIEAGAVVTDSVLLDGVKLESGAVVTRTIIDKGAVVGRDAWVGEAEGELTLIGLGARVPPAAQVGAGARLGSKVGED